MESQKKYNMEDVIGQTVNDNSAMEYNVTIPVTIPTMGVYTFDALKHELTEFAMRLVMHPKVTKEEGKNYSQRLQHLKAMSRNSITPADINDDDRLAYLLNK